MQTDDNDGGNKKENEHCAIHCDNQERGLK